MSWIWENIGHIQKSCRRSCMRSFTLLCPLLDSESSAPEVKLQLFVENYISSSGRGISSIISLVENEGRDNVLPSNLISDQSWLLQLSSSLDAYCWLFKSQLIPPNQLFSGDSARITDASDLKRRKLGDNSASAFSATTLTRSNILQNFRYFLAECSSFITSDFTPSQNDSIELRSLRCDILFRGLLFIVNALEYYKSRGDSPQPVATHLRTEGIWETPCRS